MAAAVLWHQTGLAQVTIPEVQQPGEAIVISAESAQRWNEGAYEVWLLAGACQIRQGTATARSQRAVVWIDHATPLQMRSNRVLAYLEGQVEVDLGLAQGNVRLTDEAWFGRFSSARSVEVYVGRVASKPEQMPDVYRRGVAQMHSAAAPVRQTQYTTPSPQPVAQSDAHHPWPPTGPNWPQQSSPSNGPLRGALPAWQAPAAPQQPNPTGGSVLPPTTGQPTQQYPVAGQSPPLQPPDSINSGPWQPGATPPLGPQPGANVAPYSLPAPGATSAPFQPMLRRIRAFSRSNVDARVVWFPDPTGQQWTAVIDSGVTVIIDGLTIQVGGQQLVTAIDVSADRMVIWMRSAGGEPNLGRGELQHPTVPLEIYMEGNIVFREGQRVIYADRMYYDVANHVGTVLNTELLTPAPNYQGLVRLHAEVIEQTGRDRFVARNAFITSSRMGRPGYRLQSGHIELEDIRTPVVDPWTGLPLLDEDQQPVTDSQQLASAKNNFLFLGPVPVFYWPSIATNLKDPTFYLRSARLKNDNVYGIQVLTTWNVYELLGWRNRPAGTDWELSVDYLDKRGLGHGSAFTYRRDGLLGLPGPVAGLIDFWGIADRGHDNLGLGRRDLEPEADYRYRAFAQHRHHFGDGFQFTFEFGKLSDRNFLQQFYEQEWDELKDQLTGLELKRLRENRSWSITADMRLNEFFTQTEWLPRADHFWLGQDLLTGLTWYEHTSIGYGRLRRLDAPANPADQPFSYLPWERSSQSGERIVTRHEIDWPFQFGMLKVVPYLLGEVGHWGEDIDGNNVQRVYGQAGIRANLPVWKINPYVESGLLNVHGVAHKVDFQAEFFWADSNRPLERFPLYDSLDDDNIEAFRRRFVTNTFAFPSLTPATVSSVPQPFDERYYALRTGMASWVTAPSAEIADDLMALRLGVHQRWQTKRGRPDARHIIDWIIFDTNLTWFPRETRDNYGKTLGLWDYDFRWHVGDRLTLVSDGIFDFFHDAQQVVTVGGFLTRPPRGSLYLGMRIIEGPLASKVLSLSYTYWMTPKWVSSFGTSIDFAGEGNIGQNFRLVRVGESLLVSAAVNVDAARNNVGVSFSIEPRFFPRTRLGQIGGTQIPPAGAYGLE